MAHKIKIIKYAVFKVKTDRLFNKNLGDEAWMGVCGTRKGISMLTLPCSDKEAVMKAIKERAGDALLEESPKHFESLKKELDLYFSGRQVDLEYNIDLSGFTSFQTAVFTSARSIPYGQTRSYRWVAKKIGNPKGFRAVGQGLKANSIPILIPCHRVIRENGKIGGFSSGKGWKERLLQLEGALLT